MQSYAKVPTKHYFFKIMAQCTCRVTQKRLMSIFSNKKKMQDKEYLAFFAFSKKYNSIMV